MIKLHTSKPPKSLHAARRAWRYFEAKYPKRELRSVSYVPGGQFAGEMGWLADFHVPEGTLSGAYTYDYAAMKTKFASSEEVRNYFAGTGGFWE